MPAYIQCKHTYNAYCIHQYMDAIFTSNTYTVHTHTKIRTYIIHTHKYMHKYTNSKRTVDQILFVPEFQLLFIHRT